MFNIGKTDEYGRQKRIEHRGKYLRASRTGGVSLRAQTKAAGLNVTGSTGRGIRVSTRAAKGTNVALQNGRFRLRGRYGKGPTKLNLSKSGASVSTRNALGTFNWINPNRSSAKIGGVQMREKKIARAGLDDRLRDAAALRSALQCVVTTWGRGLSTEELDQLITPGKPRAEAKQMRQVTAALAGRYAAAASPAEIGETLLVLDEAARADGERTVLQDRLIDAFADRAKPVFEPTEGNTVDDSDLTTNA